ncbi:CPBP family intramembrane glutamic endopeptidase [Aquibacillus kalidii]|uniref:CPBP family intramembrane glutamic endopeptidase n=1 Tax=Aquibacillus kalidii TaxID=2762597 RepID=UPI001649548C|nr:type II CAAX endopeptidase family protein [Aquibacillus kalidii]
MRIWGLLLGPTIMILIGLQFLNNVLVTFILFYIWLTVFSMRFIQKFTSNKLQKNVNKSVKWGLLSGIIFFLFIFCGLTLLNGYLFDIEHLQNVLKEWGFSGKAVYGLIFVLIITNPVLEELYWRGYIYEKMKHKTTILFASLVSAGFYTFYHLLSIMPLFDWPVNLAAVIPVFIAGLYWSYLREKTGSIVGPIISHVFSDLAIMFVYWFVIR